MSKLQNDLNNLIKYANSTKNKVDKANEMPFKVKWRFRIIYFKIFFTMFFEYLKTKAKNIFFKLFKINPFLTEEQKLFRKQRNESLKVFKKYSKILLKSNKMSSLIHDYRQSLQEFERDSKLSNVVINFENIDFLNIIKKNLSDANVKNIEIQNISFEDLLKFLTAIDFGNNPIRHISHSRAIPEKEINKGYLYHQEYKLWNIVQNKSEDKPNTVFTLKRYFDTREDEFTIQLLQKSLEKIRV